MTLRVAEPLARVAAPLLLRTLAATWRFRTTGDAHVRTLRGAERAFVYVLWHSRILPLLVLHRHQDIVLLISRHRDGGYIADVGERWGYRSIRGSSRRGGEVGLLRIVRTLQAGAVVAITPDGPLGPAERVKPGAVAAAQHAGVPIVPVGVRPHATWRLGTWDRMCIPKPFTTIEVEYGAPIEVGPDKDGVRQGIEAVGHALHELNRTP